MNKELEDLLEVGVVFHGHRCPAMPLGLRAGLAAMKKLGVEHASNKELFCYLESGPSHALMCFGDGVQVATGCTYGKGTIKKLYYSKIGITLVDVKKQKQVRVAIQPEFLKKAVDSPFAKMRKDKIEPKDIAPEILAPLLNNIMSKSDEELFKISEVTDSNFTPPKGTFELLQCDGCGETLFDTGLKEVNGKQLCTTCREK